MRKTPGFTLWELIWTLAVAATVLAFGVPGFERFVLDMRRTADVNSFVTAVQLARSESAKRRRTMVLCKTADTVVCGDAAIGYEQGWMVFANDDRDRPPVRDSGEDLLLFHDPASAGTVRSNRPWYEFRPFSIRSTNGTVTFCDGRGPTAARAVIISYTGRPRTSDRGPGRRALTCAGFP
jgi:type IV fimbrial biogenesis protein FimT